MAQWYIIEEMLLISWQMEYTRRDANSSIQIYCDGFVKAQFFSSKMTRLRAIEHVPVNKYKHFNRTLYEKST